MNVLALDTSTEILSIALVCDPPGADATRDRTKSEPLPGTYAVTRDVGLKHSRLLMPLIDRLLGDAGLRPSDLDLVACTRGPGSFTGLRIGMATAKGLATSIAAHRGLQTVPMISVPTLNVMAHGLPCPGALVVPVIDGRKGRFYAALFRDQEQLTGDLDLSAEDIMERIRAVAENAQEKQVPGEHLTTVITGPHAGAFISRVDPAQHVAIDPKHRRGHAESLVSLALAAYDRYGPDDPTQGPVYVRSSDAELERSVPS